MLIRKEIYMSKPKYAIVNKDLCVAVVWDTEMGLVTVTNDIKIDFNCDLTLIDITGGTNSCVVNNIDLRDLLVSLLPKAEDNIGE